MQVSHSQEAKQIIRNGLIKKWELVNKRLDIMGQAVFKWTQFPCNYFGGKLAGIRVRMQPATPFTCIYLDYRMVAKALELSQKNSRDLGDTGEAKSWKLIEIDREYLYW